MAATDEMQRTAWAERPRGLPGHGLALLYVLVALAPLGAAVLTGETTRFWRELGTGLGLAAAALLLLQFLTSGRYESISGRIGIDRTMGFHRVAAWAVLAFAAAHPLAYVASTAMSDPVAGLTRLLGLLTSPSLRSGVVALLALTVLIGLAVARPHLKYEAWRASHGVLAVVAATGTLHHALTRGSDSADPPLLYVWIGLAALCLAALTTVYLVRPWRMWREGWRVDYVRRIGDKTVEMGLVTSNQRPASIRGGQFIWLALSPNRPPFHDHPFSVASGPDAWPRLRLIVRESGNCTDHFADVAPGTAAAVDGPHGSFVLPAGSGSILMIAGGVGIAPLLGMLEEAAARGERRAIRLIYAARRPDALSCLARLKELSETLDLELRPVVEEGGDGAFEIGRLTEAHVIAAIGDWAPETVSALVCGPGPLLDLAQNALLAAGIPARSIHYERFDFGVGGGLIDRRRRRASLLILGSVLLGVVAFALR